MRASNISVTSIFLFYCTVFPGNPQRTRVLWTLCPFCLGQSLGLREPFPEGKSGLLRQQEVLSWLFQRVSIYLHILEHFLVILEYIRYAVFRSSRKCARLFRNGQRIHRGGNSCASFQKVCVGYTALDSACSWRGRPWLPDVPVLECSRELLEQASDNGIVVSNLCSLLVLFPLVPRLHDCLF